jgi:hypothetical protein
MATAKNTKGPVRFTPDNLQSVRQMVAEGDSSIEIEKANGIGTGKRQKHVLPSQNQNTPYAAFHKKHVVSCSTALAFIARDGAQTRRTANGKARREPLSYRSSKGN